MGTFTRSRTWSETQVLEQDYGFSFVTTGPSVGPNLDPRRPRQMPIAPGINIEVWWAVTELLMIKEYENIKLFQHLKSFCTEKWKDECGIERELNTSSERDELVSDKTNLISSSLKSKLRLLRKLFSL